ncbi:hypothetical protein FD38_GL001275 [Levilactobacillus zymae DSM 19395]|nr:hypothetical protein FD38_GL001275 [Levilactobacillus zymae DSM 19395]
MLELCESYGGGVKTQLDFLNTYLDKKKFDFVVMVSSKRENGIPSDYIIEDKLSEIKNPIKFLESLMSINKVVKKNQVQIVHAHSTIAGIAMVLYKMIFFSKIPVIFTPHAYYSEMDRGVLKNGILRLIERFMNHFFSCVIHVSKEEEGYALRSNLVAGKKSVVVNNGVPKQELVNQSHKETTFINVARCADQKNPSKFIDLAQIILNELDCKFVWVGDGPLLESCRAKVKKLDLDSKIKFVGYSNNVASYLKKADVYLSTSRYEGLPFSVLEALSYGLPLLLTDIIGHKSLVKNNGYLLSDSDKPYQIKKRAADILENEESYSAASLELYSSEYSIEKMINGIQKVYLSNI